MCFDTNFGLPANSLKHINSVSRYFQVHDVDEVGTTWRLRSAKSPVEIDRSQLSWISNQFRSYLLMLMLTEKKPFTFISNALLLPTHMEPPNTALNHHLHGYGLD